MVSYMWPQDRTLIRLKRLRENHRTNSKTMTAISTFIFKVASRCNLNCTYCYEYNMGDQSWRTQPHFVSIETLRIAARRIAEHCVRHSLKAVEICFHGGEPLLAGADFFRTAASIFRETLRPHADCNFGIQTNGTLLTQELINVLKSEAIHLGLSLEGPRDVNDKSRKYGNGRGSYEDVTKSLPLLLGAEGKEIFSGILAVIDVSSDPLDVFETLASISPPSLDFLLPHGNWASPPPARTPDPSVTPYADWLIRIFDAWFSGRHWEISIRMFEEIIEHQLGGTGHLESLGLAPVTLVCVAADGSIEGVDTLKASFPGAHSLGLNIYEHSFDDALEHPTVRERQIGIKALCKKCVECRHVRTCGAGYYPHRWSPSRGFQNPSVYCPDLIKLISHIEEAVCRVLDRDSDEAVDCRRGLRTARWIAG
jgi:uncharacterized protein